MKHIHKYETFLHKPVSAELKDSGIESAEIRKCAKCGDEMPFILTRKGHWVPLFKEEEADQQDILLA
jgi:ssDNA-binding Zn-finger/Zn-ribbon topoisomerase 1